MSKNGREESQCLTYQVLAWTSRNAQGEVSKGVRVGGENVLCFSSSTHDNMQTNTFLKFACPFLSLNAFISCIPLCIHIIAIILSWSIKLIKIKFNIKRIALNWFSIWWFSSCLFINLLLLTFPVLTHHVVFKFSSRVQVQFLSCFNCDPIFFFLFHFCFLGFKRYISS